MGAQPNRTRADTMLPATEREHDLERRLAEAEATIRALRTGRSHAVLDATSSSPVLLAEAQAALKEAEGQMRFALESAKVGIWDIDYPSGLLEWSDVMETQYGLELGTFGGTYDDFLALVHSYDRASVVETVEAAMETGGDFTVLHRAVWPDGTVRWLSGTGHIVLDARGQPLRGIGISQDVTERKCLESQYLQGQRMEAVGRLAGGIAHDFNNILSVILTTGDLLLEDMTLADPVREDVEVICSAGRQAAELTRQLLMFSRQQVLAPKVLDLAAVVAGMEDMLQRVLGEDVVLEFRNEKAAAWVRADAGCIEQVIMNLVLNARDAMPTGGRLVIETRNTLVDGRQDGRLFHVTPGRHVVLSVRDTGCGIDEATQARMFEPFFTTKEVGKGTGLGLATVFGIVRQSDGEIRVDTRLGSGTTFTIYLPQVDAVVESEDTEQSTPRPRGTETILLVEDEDQVRAVARTILQRAGYHVIDMATAAHALAFARKSVETLHLLLTDVVMPVMGGPELARRLVAMRPDVRVLYMSGYTDDEMVRHGVMNGTPFVQKPFTLDSLAGKVREVLASEVSTHETIPAADSRHP